MWDLLLCSLVILMIIIIMVMIIIITVMIPMKIIMIITIIVLKAVSAPVQRESPGRHKETAPALLLGSVKIGEGGVHRENDGDHHHHPYDHDHDHIMTMITS